MKLIDIGRTRGGGVFSLLRIGDHGLIHIERNRHITTISLIYFINFVAIQ